jgi:hypothetical protein
VRWDQHHVQVQLDDDRLRVGLAWAVPAAVRRRGPVSAPKGRLADAVTDGQVCSQAAAGSRARGDLDGRHVPAATVIHRLANDLELGVIDDEDQAKRDVLGREQELARAAR